MQERQINLWPGYPFLVGHLLLIAGIAFLFRQMILTDEVSYLFGIIPSILVATVMLIGYTIVSPNQAKVIQLFGEYVGTVKDVGFFWGNPFYYRQTVSLRVRTFETGVQKTPEVKDATGKVVQEAQSRRMPTKVNDKDGTPIEIAAVVTFKVVNAAEALFVVDDYEGFIEIQSDAALRNLASQYSYDSSEESSGLRGHIEEVSEKLKIEIQHRVAQAGIRVIGAQISSLAYAPEIASAMLQRQQASAVIAARRLIVDGAVGMVEHALDELAKKQLLELDGERKAAMVSNLLVVLCSHSAPQPVMNTGTLHN
jgi:regulator of protease activity HflC (stomatin/prohibitin superfamily)